jgi:Leucine-rich repeat (LRR) protein
VWLHSRRFKTIENMERFTGVTMLHLENNQLGAIGTGLAHMSKLKALYLHCNMLRRVDANLAGRRWRTST